MSDLYAHLRVGACDIAVAVQDIARAVELPADGVTPLPRRQGALAGMIEFEGSAVPVVGLERWVPLAEPVDSATARVVVLRSGAALIGLRVDALLGTQRLPPAALRTVCHDAAADELFEAIAPATADRPLLCRLEVARLMALALTWCEAAELRPGRWRAAAPRRSAGAAARYALFTIGNRLWALPAAAIARIDKTPPAELRWAAQRTCGIGTWGARKLPLVDLGHADPKAQGDCDELRVARPWMAVLVREPVAIGLVVSRIERFLDLTADDILPTPGEELRAGTAMLAELGEVSVLDVGRLLDAVPEASISRLPVDDVKSTTAAPAAVRSTATAVSGHATSHYLVFEADRPYATPVDGVVGVVALPPAAIDHLVHGRRATIEWRGQTIGVVNLPSIDGRGGAAATPPRIAVVIDATGDGQARSALAVRSLNYWLPARMARHSSMRMPSVGEVGVITPVGSPRGGSLVVVDLKQMAYLLG